ncbi:hypothetical protein COCVIDRAFT_14320 [Bipolaris victoriae FI3]|uniref:Uncharacterized protein n=1 Tax=Bipolaris victoriae (strain FI3) TaxID=930091 RepID=W7EEE9_BIPV3|nr:hypothetical protein COCVIDRAFT_14320 [Bipolaris victoriae FI3]
MPTYLPACHAETSSRLPRCPSAQAGLSSTSTRKNPLPQSPRPVNRPSQHSTPPSILTRQQLSIALVASHSLQYPQGSYPAPSSCLKGYCTTSTMVHLLSTPPVLSQSGRSINTHPHAPLHMYTLTDTPTTTPPNPTKLQLRPNAGLSPQVPSF